MPAGNCCTGTTRCPGRRRSPPSHRLWRSRERCDWGAARRGRRAPPIAANFPSGIINQPSDPAPPFVRYVVSGRDLRRTPMEPMPARVVGPLWYITARFACPRSGTSAVQNRPPCLPSRLALSGPQRSRCVLARLNTAAPTTSVFAVGGALARHGSAPRCGPLRASSQPTPMPPKGVRQIYRVRHTVVRRA